MSADILKAFHAEYDGLLRLAAAILNDTYAAYDIVQSIAVKILEERFQDVACGAYIPYLRKSTRNAALDYLKKSKRASITDPEKLCYHLYDMTDFGRAEIKLWVDAYFVKQSSKIREAFFMHYIDGYTFKEVAQITGINSNTLRTTFKRLLAALPKSQDRSILFSILLCNIT